MGYWEVPCQFCGVSFNIDRVRMKDEPRSAATRAGLPHSWVEGRNFSNDKEQREFERQQGVYEMLHEDDYVPPEEPCSDATGCAMVRRERSMYGGREAADASLYEDDPEDGIMAHDPSYEYRSDSEYEPMEYDSEYSEEEEEEEEEEDIDDEMDTDESEAADGEDWIFRVKGPDPPEYDTEFLPLDFPIGVPMYHPTRDRGFRSNPVAREISSRLEHVGGPGCRYEGAYIGKNISPEQMRGCHTVQGILRRPRGSEPQDDDLEFERGSKYFLTGVAERMPSSGSFVNCYPVRYEADDDVNFETHFVLETTQEQLHQTALPFHPACFELYIQATRLRNTRINLNALMRIRDECCIQRWHFPVTYDQDVIEATEQAWQHNVGTEYLVANPVFVPGLRAMLESAISSDENFCVQNSAFEARPPRDDLLSQDPFLRFPVEIIQTIAGYLDASDVAQIRLSSRAFTHLPISFFRELVLAEMPWLYEALSPDTKPYYWATVVARDLLVEKNTRPKFMAEIQQRRDVTEEVSPEVMDQFRADEPQYVPPRSGEWQEIQDLAPISLPRDKTNWYKVYCGIKSNWSQFQGLQNRERIWKNVNQVVDAINKYRKGLDYFLPAEDYENIHRTYMNRCGF